MTYTFDKIPIEEDCVFWSTPLSYAFTNLKCFRPGHVLVAPKRVVQYYSDLTSEERKDLIKLTKSVSDLIQRYYNADQGYCVAMQDGKSAGQTVPHVHYHVIPKIPKNPSPQTQAYYKLVKYDMGDVPMLKTYARSLEERAAEVSCYKAFKQGEIIQPLIPFLH